MFKSNLTKYFKFAKLVILGCKDILFDKDGKLLLEYARSKEANYIVQHLNEFYKIVAVNGSYVDFATSRYACMYESVATEDIRNGSFVGKGTEAADATLSKFIEKANEFHREGGYDNLVTSLEEVKSIAKYENSSTAARVNKIAQDHLLPIVGIELSNVKEEHKTKVICVLHYLTLEAFRLYLKTCEEEGRCWLAEGEIEELVLRYVDIIKNIMFTEEERIAA